MLAYLLIICVAFLVVAASLTRMVGEYLFTQKVREEQRVTLDAAAALTPALTTLDAAALYQGAASISAQNGGRVLVLDTNGVVQADAESAYNGHRMAMGEVARVLSGEAEDAYGFYDMDGEGGDFWTRLGKRYAGSALLGVYAAAMSSHSTRMGVLVYMSDSREVFESLNLMQRQMGLWLVLVAMAVLILSWMVSRIFTRPIEELSQGIERMTAGDLTSRVTVRGHNEFSQLAEAFNMMSTRLQTLDQTRNQFISNASHELKTPLSAMKILIETLLYQEAYDPAMQKEFLTDINGEIDRLNAIVGDLLTLVQLDSGRAALKVERLRLDELVQSVTRRLSPIAQKRQIQLECVVRDKIETTGDAMKLTQVFYNLVDNAIKYTPEGGRVRAEVARNGRKAVVKVSDTGIGIPEADRLHIFDRFYRVDKARARATGGTGLGLSIVKQFVMLHEGAITVESVEEQGSVFTVELPIINL